MKIHFATIATSRYWTSETILLAKSLRAFGGEFASQSITVFTPEKQAFPLEIQAEFDQLSIQASKFSLPEEAAKFPLGLIPYGAAAAETYLADQAIKKDYETIRICYRALFAKYMEDLLTEQMQSPVFGEFLENKPTAYTDNHVPAAIVRDFIAGMTDNYFLRSAAGLGCLTPDKIRI